MKKRFLATSITGGKIIKRKKVKDKMESGCYALHAGTKKIPETLKCNKKRRKKICRNHTIKNRGEYPKETIIEPPRYLNTLLLNKRTTNT